MNPLIVKGVVFGLLLACAALWDMKEREIPNLIPAMILVCGLIEPRPAASVAGLLVTGGPYLLAALLTHGKTLAIGGGDIKLMGACGFVLGVWPGLLHSILSLILAVLTGVKVHGEFQKVSTISASLQKRLLENGMPPRLLERIAGGGVKLDTGKEETA